MDTIEKYLEKSHNYLLIPNKKKKLNYGVQDGIIIFNVSFDNLIKCHNNLIKFHNNLIKCHKNLIKCHKNLIKCQCSNNIYCNHILFILCDIYKLSPSTILYLPFVYDYFLEKIKNNQIKDLNKILEEKIFQYFDTDDCGICLNKLTEGKNYMKFYICNQCTKASHIHCFNEWNKKNNICIYCRSIIE
jgi:hypothetical protein